MNNEIKPGITVKTPRFLNVMIRAVFSSEKEAIAAGFTEPTHYDDGEHSILGMGVGNLMVFAAVKRPFRAGKFFLTADYEPEGNNLFVSHSGSCGKEYDNVSDSNGIRDALMDYIRTNFQDAE